MSMHRENEKEFTYVEKEGDLTVHTEVLEHIGPIVLHTSINNTPHKQASVNSSFCACVCEHSITASLSLSLPLFF